MSSLVSVLHGTDDCFSSFEVATGWLATVEMEDFEVRCAKRLGFMVPLVWTAFESPWPGLEEIANLKGCYARHRM